MSMASASIDQKLGTPQRHLAFHAAFLLLMLFYLFAYRGTLIDLVKLWSHDGTFQYGYIIAPISVFLIWMRRGQIRQLQFRPNMAGLALIVAAVVIWLLGNMVGIAMVAQFGVLVLPPSLVLAVYGANVGKALLFPLCYLFFALPWPAGGITTVLQHFTARFAVDLLQVTGFSAVLHGVLIETPIETWHVAKACSGIKFFVASLALGALYAHLFYRSSKRRLIFMVFAFFVPILANGLRVYFTVIIGEVFGIRYATGTDHLIFGWQFFGTTLIIFFLVARIWAENPERVSTPRVPSNAMNRATPWLTGIMAAIVLALGPLYLMTLRSAVAKPFTPTIAKSGPLGWKLLIPHANPLGGRFRGTSHVYTATYLRNDKYVNWVSAAYSGLPRHGHKLFMAGNRLYDQARWHMVKAQNHVAGGWRQLLVSNGRTQRLIRYRYRVNHQDFFSMRAVKWRQLLHGLLRRPMVTEVEEVSIPLSKHVNGKDSAEKWLQAFTTGLLKAKNQGRATTDGHS